MPGRLIALIARCVAAFAAVIKRCGEQGDRDEIRQQSRLAARPRRLSAPTARCCCRWPGVFFLLPSLASALFLSDLQAEHARRSRQPGRAERLMQGYDRAGHVASDSFSFVLQVGRLSGAAGAAHRPRAADRGRGDRRGFAGPAALIGAALLFVARLFAGDRAVGAGRRRAGAVTGLGCAGGRAGAAVSLRDLSALIKLSLTAPVIVIEKAAQPVRR